MMTRDEILNIQNVLSNEFWEEIIFHTEARYGQDMTIGNIRDVHNEIGHNKRFLNEIPGLKGHGKKISPVPDEPGFGDEMPTYYKHMPKDLAHFLGHLSGDLGLIPEHEVLGLMVEFGLYNDVNAITYSLKFFQEEKEITPFTDEKIISNIRSRYRNDSKYVDKSQMKYSSENEPFIKGEIKGDEYGIEYKRALHHYGLGMVISKQIAMAANMPMHDKGFKIDNFVNIKYPDVRLTGKNREFLENLTDNNLKDKDLKQPGNRIILERFSRFKNAIDNSNLVEK